MRKLMIGTMLVMVSLLASCCLFSVMDDDGGDDTDITLPGDGATD